jgi:mannose-6-phosphate isomerase
MDGMQLMSYGVVLEGALRDYAWGRQDGLRTWTGRRTGGPEAELWFGTHPAAPSPTVLSLPEGTARQTDAPLLVKILAAAKPLSLQVHPSQSAIEQIRRTSAAGLLVDGGEKAELLVAVERFEALAGLRPASEGARILRAMGLDRAADLLADGDVRGAIGEVLSGSDQPDLEAALATLPAVERVILGKAVAAFPGDRGLPVAFLMQPHVLEPGDALCVPVGTVHAYVDGVGVEVMTSCDNVFRLGLTPKTVSVEAALIALDPDRSPTLIRADAEGHYDCEHMPFVLTRVEGSGADLGRGAIALALQGSLTVSSPLGSLRAQAGQAVYVEQDGAWTLTTSGVAYVATPRDSNPCGTV